jgi:uncharacterized membrane protein YfcA
MVAFLYASVGHGGASGYLALMVLFGISPVVMKSSALMLNIFVSAIAFLQYYRHGHFRWKILLPFILLSIPPMVEFSCVCLCADNFDCANRNIHAEHVRW